VRDEDDATVAPDADDDKIEARDLKFSTQQSDE
jgi:hypothetical protein